METATALLLVAAGLVAGALFGYLLGGRATSAAREALARKEAELEGERARAGEKVKLLEDATARLKDTFEALSHEALRKSQTSLLEIARADLDQRRKAIEDVVKPVTDSLRKVDLQLQEVERLRAGAYAGLVEQVKALATSQAQLQSETSSLSQALRAPIARGKWGEMQLRRVVEMAGMLEHCDFVEQTTFNAEDGATLRPDMLVRLPGGRTVVVDAKVPLAAYLDATESDDEKVRDAKLREHAKRVREHMVRLGQRRYHQQIDPAPEFVVMFLPGESFFGAALRYDAALIEFGVEQGVIPASPTTLIALLRSVAYGWRQEQLAENAKEISALGRQLHERLRTMTEHVARVGKNLDAAVHAYNQTVASLETRVLVTARRFQELGAAPGDAIAEPDEIERHPRALQED